MTQTEQPATPTDRYVVTLGMSELYTELRTVRRTLDDHVAQQGTMLATLGLRMGSAEQAIAEIRSDMRQGWERYREDRDRDATQRTQLRWTAYVAILSAVASPIVAHFIH